MSPRERRASHTLLAVVSIAAAFVATVTAAPVALGDGGADPGLDVYGAWHLHNTGQSGGSPGVDLGIVDAWKTTHGSGQRIAIVDTGVDLEHPDLSIVPGYDFGRDDDDPGPDLVSDDYPHGTAMAGIAAGRGLNDLGIAGVAPEAEILPVKVVGGRVTYADVAAALRYAVDRDASVLSNAWGYSDETCAPVEVPDVIGEAIDYAETHGRNGLGAVVVMSAGNGGCDLADDELLADERLVVVGAFDHHGARAAYSNVGVALDLMGPSAAADGAGGLWTTDVRGVLGYDNQSDYWGGTGGTSAAAAAVSGVFALMFAANPGLTASEARQIACETAIKDAVGADFDAEGRSAAYGCGRIDASAAVAAALALAPANDDDGESPQSAAAGCQVHGSSPQPWFGAALALFLLALRRSPRPRCRE